MAASAGLPANCSSKDLRCRRGHMQSCIKQEAAKFFIIATAHAYLHCWRHNHVCCVHIQGLAIGFVLLRVEGLVEEGKL